MILTVNTGSSSLKFKLYGRTVVKGKIEEIGTKRSIATINNKKVKKFFPNHEAAAQFMLKVIESRVHSFHNIEKVAYRVVHGGEIKKPSIITKKVMKTIQEFSEIAPLHNLPALRVIKYLKLSLPIAKHVAFFDTSFHHTIPEKAYLYAIPKKLAKKYKIRKYGFHGLSHEFLYNKVKGNRVITCHLGNGSSITAIKNGKSVDTTMGFSPLDGLMMGTRPGGLDPEIVLYLMSKEHMTTKQMEQLLNTKSGLFGLTGTSDLRVIHKRALRGNKECKLAIEMLVYNAAKHINAFRGILGGVNAIVFGGGIGEEAGYIRKKILSYVPAINLDEKANKKNEWKIAHGITSVYVIPTDESYLMYQQVKKF